MLGTRAWPPPTRAWPPPTRAGERAIRGRRGRACERALGGSLGAGPAWCLGRGVCGPPGSPVGTMRDGEPGSEARPDPRIYRFKKLPGSRAREREFCKLGTEATCSSPPPPPLFWGGGGGAGVTHLFMPFDRPMPGKRDGHGVPRERRAEAWGRCPRRGPAGHRPGGTRPLPLVQAPSLSLYARGRPVADDRTSFFFGGSWELGDDGFLVGNSKAWPVSSQAPFLQAYPGPAGKQNRCSSDHPQS